MTSDGSRDFVYDAVNRLIQVKNHATQANIASFEYDASGRRTSKTVGATVTKYFYDGDSTRILSLPELFVSGIPAVNGS